MLVNVTVNWVLREGVEGFWDRERIGIVERIKVEQLQLSRFNRKSTMNSSEGM